MTNQTDEGQRAGDEYFTEMYADYKQSCDCYDGSMTIIKERAVEAFAAGIAFERQRGRWVDVRERLPEPDKIILLWDGKECWFGRSAGIDDGTLFYVHFGYDGKYMSNITHWQPLPPAPTDGAKV